MTRNNIKVKTDLTQQSDSEHIQQTLFYRPIDTMSVQKTIAALLLLILICATQYNQFLTNRAAITLFKNISLVDNQAYQIINDSPLQFDDDVVTAIYSAPQDNPTIKYLSAFVHLVTEPSLEGKIPQLRNRTPLLRYINAGALIQKGAHAEGIAILDSLGVHPTLFALGIESYREGERPEEAVAYLETAYALSANPSYLIHLSVAHRKLIESAENLPSTEAQEILETIVAKSQNDVVLSEAYTKLSLVVEDAPVLETYLLHIEQSQMLESTYMMTAYRNLLQKSSQIYLQQQANAELFTVAQKGGILFPTISEFFYWQGLARERQNQYDEAIVYYEQALSLKPDYQVYIKSYQRLLQLQE